MQNCVEVEKSRTVEVSGEKDQIEINSSTWSKNLPLIINGTESDGINRQIFRKYVKDNLDGHPCELEMHGQCTPYIAIGMSGVGRQGLTSDRQRAKDSE